MIDTDGEPLRLAMRAEPDVVSPNELEAEELVGHEFNDDDDRAAGGRRDDPARRPRGDHDRVATAATPRCSRTARRALYRVPVEEQEARSRGRLRRRVPGRLRRRPLRRARRRSSACASASPAAPSRPQHFGAGIIDAGRGRAAARRGRGRASSRSAPRSAEPAELPKRGSEVSPADAAATIDRPMVAAIALRSPVRLRRPTDRCNGSRDRPRQEGPARVRLRRHRDRAVAADARPRRRRHHLDARPLPVRAAAARGRARRRRLARRRPA